VVDGAIRVAPGVQLKIVDAPPATEEAGERQRPVAAEAWPGQQEQLKVTPSDKGSAP